MPKRTVKTNREVSVVVVCHNNFKLTTKCIDRIKNASAEAEIILVDNNSNDETQGWAEKQDQIVYLRNQMNLGCAIGRNQGAKWATRDYILFLDNDQFIGEGYIECLLDLDVDIAGCEHWKVGGDGITHRQVNDVMTNMSYVGSGGMLIRTEVFHELGGYDERYAPAWYEDVDFSFRAKEAGYSIAILLKADIEHFAGGGATSKLQLDYNSAKAKRRSRELFIKLWGAGLSEKTSYYKIKPKIVILVDVHGWAWDNKAQEIAKHLSDEFNIMIHYEGLEKVPPCHLLFAFEKFSQYEMLVDYYYCIGVTAHTYTNFPNYEKYMKSAAAIHANSKMLYQQIKSMNQKCYYLPNGVNPEKFLPTVRDIREEFTVGYVGKDTKGKGLRQFIIPACEKVGVRLEAQSCKYNSDNKIKHSDMHKFYGGLDAIMIASDMDGTPNQLLEAACCGRTFISCAIGNVPEFYNGKNGFVVERNIEAYVEKLQWMKKNRVAVKEMGGEARKTAIKEWTWERQVEHYRGMFREII